MSTSLLFPLVLTAALCLFFSLLCCSISDFLDMRGYQYTRLDGSTNRVMREVRINLFNKPVSPLFMFCLSTRAGGEGVNLFTADTVILFDRYCTVYVPHFELLFFLLLGQPFQFDIIILFFRFTLNCAFCAVSNANT
jgi:hypothetical protein